MVIRPRLCVCAVAAVMFILLALALVFSTRDTLAAAILFLVFLV